MTPYPAPHSSWGFYGREEEIRTLRWKLNLEDEFPRRQTFHAFIIGGRRGVGKNSLLEETVRRHGDLKNLLVVALPDDRTADACLSELMEKAELHMSSRLHNLPPRSEWCRDASRFAVLVRHLLDQGVIICLDEFHNAENTGLESALKLLIDEAKKPSTPEPTGRLVFMGSHQQHVGRMFGPTRPLHLRAMTDIQLLPWSLPTTLSMAAEQGWSHRPGRLLTLWSAFGGMPYLWKRFADPDLTPRDLRVWPDPTGNRMADRNADRQWRQKFVDHQHAILRAEPDECWDNRAIIELDPDMRQAFIWMGRNPDRKHRIKDFPIEFRGEKTHQLRQTLDRFQRNSRLVRRHDQFTGLPGEEWRWTIDDNNTIFQIDTFTDMFRFNRPQPKRGLKTALEVSQTPLERLQGLEGTMLERMAAEWLEAHPQVQWSLTNVRISGQDQKDIDVLARIGHGDADDVLIVGSARRNPEEHAKDEGLDGFCTSVEAFMQSTDYEVEAIRALRRCHVLLSPVFPAGQRASYEAAGFDCFDIPSMTAELTMGWPRLTACMEAVQAPEPDDNGPSPF